MDAQGIVRELIDSIEEKNFYHGVKVERMKTEHREEIKKIREKLDEANYQKENEKNTGLGLLKRFNEAMNLAKEIMDVAQHNDFIERLK